MQIETFKKQVCQIFDSIGTQFSVVCAVFCGFTLFVAGYFFVNFVIRPQIYELHSKNLDLEKRNDRAEFEAKRAKEKQQTLEAENEVSIS